MTSACRVDGDSLLLLFVRTKINSNGYITDPPSSQAVQWLPEALLGAIEPHQS